MKDLIEAREKLTAKQKELHGIFELAGEDLDMSKVTTIDGDSAAKVAHIAKLNAELDTLGKEVERLQEVVTAAENTRKVGTMLATPVSPIVHPAAPGSPITGLVVPSKSLGQLFAEAKGLWEGPDGSKVIIKHRPVDIDLSMREIKTLMETGAGWAPETTRTGRLVLDAQRPIEVTDLIPSTETMQAAVVYMEETTFTTGAAEIAEGGTYGEAVLVLTERSSTVRKIGVWLPVTDEQLEDVPQVQGYIDNRLTFMLRQRLDSQILVGDGNAPNLTGILNTAGIQTQAKGADPTPDAIYKAMTLVRVTGRANPSAVILHPNDWQAIRLLRTADGIYIWGSPSEAGPERIWGVPVVQTSAETENTGLVGDFRVHTELSMRRGIEVQVTNAHDDFFIKGKQAIRADLRTAFIVYRPAAFCTVTGI